MEWLEVSISVEAEVAEAVAEVLSRYAEHGVAIEAGPGGLRAGPVVVRAYLPADDQLWAQRRRVEEALWHLGQIQHIPPPDYRTVAEEDWAEAWKERMSVLHVGRHLVIRPSWLDYQAGASETIIQLDPGMAFGTGLHPTTQICLAAIEELTRPEMRVLDLGTGSGILAIAAAKLGAARVLALDTDPVAVRTARENVSANNAQGAVEVAQGSLKDVPGDYDLVVVNILAKTIIDMAQAGLAERVKAGGTLVAAGILAHQASQVVAALGDQGLALVEQRQAGDWACLLARRGQLRGC